MQAPHSSLRNRAISTYYACGGYITKGRSICEMNAIGQKVLEEMVIKMVLDFYKPF
ncbi:MAG: recombinase zinc ribbon domain-containing protein, partial [Planctomycetota bacterium]